MGIEPRRGDKLGAGADIRLCWTCGSCDFECPVNIATGRLRPQKIVRLAALGMIEELVCLPEIWYCQRCLRCSQICPNTVKPAVLIDAARAESVSSGRISLDSFRRHRELFARFQRVRWRAAAAALEGKAVELTEARWQSWLTLPIPPPSFGVIPGNMMPAFSTFRKPMQETGILRCFTCGECSSACPIACHRHVFDPRALLRMVHLGLGEELFRSPSLWLCLECNRCTEACSQKVDGRQMIGRLREIAVQSGAVGPAFFTCMEQFNRIIYSRLLDEIDELFGFSSLQVEACQRRAYA